MTDRRTASTITETELDQLYDQLDALRTVARGYCPTCGRGDAAPTVTDWEQQKQRADQVEDLLRIAHDTSNKSEAERAQAVQRAETAERDAGIYRKRLARLTDGYAEQFRHLEHAEATLARIRALADRWDRDAPPPGNRPLTELRAALDEPTPGPAAAKPPACRYCPDPLCPETCPECGGPIHDLDAVPSAAGPAATQTTEAARAEAVRQMDADTTNPHTGLVIQPYTVHGEQKWVFRCWGTDTCDGWLSLDHTSQQSAERARDRHVTEEHTS